VEVDGHELWADTRPLHAPPARGHRVVLHFLPGDATLLSASAETSRRGAGPVAAASPG
jgi:hypothetical protein